MKKKEEVKVSIKRKKKNKSEEGQEIYDEIKTSKVVKVESEEVKDLSEIKFIVLNEKKFEEKDAYEYMIGDGVEEAYNRSLLYRYYKVTYKNENECPSNCKVCSEQDKTYLECFALLKRTANELLGIKDEIEVRVKENIVEPLNNVFKCDTCYIQGITRCPKYKMHATCAFNFSADVDFSDTETALKYLVNIQKERVFRGALFEKVDGGVPDKNLSSEIGLLSSLIEQIDQQKLNKNGFNIKVSASGQGTGSGIAAQIISSIFGQKQLPENQPKELTEGSIEAEPAKIIESKEKTK